MLRALLLCAGLGLSAPALAHYPVMDCSRDGESVDCRVGYSDGTLGTGAEVVMYSYDDEEIARAKADARSEVRFPWSELEFYIQFDVGHEQPAEFDYVEL
ncbi:hypothetical protein [uncultured Oceanisphaera sp.]|uniref:hypothetical protein n=1 Tax=uncultured Oceanisphaera sp. TaxID=353858 RepID=UPI00261C5EC4|nr:hypothetical protein [uncultured Oceanisphaera sp.]